MAYDTNEKSQHGGTPVECFLFARGSTTWLYTSSEREVTIAAGTFVPGYVKREAISFHSEDAAGAIEIRLPRTSEVAAPYIQQVPPQRTTLAVWRCHRGDEANPILTFSGRSTAARFEESEAILTFAPLTQLLSRKIPTVLYQSQCAWRLYGTGCGVNLDDFHWSATIDEPVTEPTWLKSADFAEMADGWFTGGFVLRTNGERRFIVDHVGIRVTLSQPFPGGVPVGETVTAYAGCDRTEAVCLAKFDNLGRYFGFTHIPTRNPLREGI
jgi:uncharacterized phage protein (TIGR02218 family)